MKKMLLLLAIIVIVVTAGCGQTKTADKPSTQTTPSKTVSQTIPTMTATKGAYKAIIYSWQQSSGEASDQPSQGKVYVVVDVEIKNNATTDTPTMDMTTQFSLWDNAGHKYTPAMYFPSPSFPFDSAIPAEGKVRGLIAFEVPTPLPSGLAFGFSEPYGTGLRVPLR